MRSDQISRSGRPSGLGCEYYVAVIYVRVMEKRMDTTIRGSGVRVYASGCEYITHGNSWILMRLKGLPRPPEQFAMKLSVADAEFPRRPYMQRAHLKLEDGKICRAGGLLNSCGKESIPKFSNYPPLRAKCLLSRALQP